MGANERRKIREGIRELGKAGAHEIYQGEVDSVDEDNLTIDVKLNDDVIIPEVRLKATIDNDKGEYVIPKKGSHVLIAQMDGGVEFCLLRASEITKTVFKIEGTTYVADKDGIVMNDGNNKGLLILDKSVERWNKIEDDVNNLKTIFQTVLSTVVNEPGNGAPSAFQTALKTALGSYYGQQLQKTTAAQIENDKVKH